MTSRITNLHMYYTFKVIYKREICYGTQQCLVTRKLSHLWKCSSEGFSTESGAGPTVARRVVTACSHGRVPCWGKSTKSNRPSDEGAPVIKPES